MIVKVMSSALLLVAFWVGSILAQTQSDDHDSQIVYYANEQGVWQFNETTGRTQLWIDNEGRYQYRPLTTIDHQLVFVVDELTGALYSGIASESELTSVARPDGDSIVVDAVFDLIVADDHLIFAEPATGIWHTYNLQTGNVDELYQMQELRACGDNVRHLDERLLNPFRFSAGWYADELLIPINCVGGVQAIDQTGSSRVLIEELRLPRQNRTGELMLGNYGGALGVFEATDGDLRVLHTDFIGNYQNWWWHGDAVLFTVVERLESTLFFDFPDQMLADFFLGGWYPIGDPVGRYRTSLYYWRWGDNDEPRLLWSQDNVRGVESIAFTDRGIYFVAVDSVYPLMQALRGTPVDGVNRAITPPTFEELEQLTPQQRIMFLIWSEIDRGEAEQVGTGYALISSR